MRERLAPSSDRHTVKARSPIRAIRESGLSEGPDCLIAYLSELRFINPKSDTSEF
jgi:hypothetical protein